MVNTTGSNYPPIVLDNTYGQVISITLDKVDAIVDYILNLSMGSLVGGTSPAFTISESNPVVTHISIKANNETIRDFDTPMLYEYMSKTRGTASDGYAYHIPMTDIQYSLKKRILNSLFPSYGFTQIKLYLTIAPLSQITSGSPTGTSGAVGFLTEYSLPRQSINFKILDFRQLQVESAMSLTGENDLTQFISTDGYYKSLLYFANTGQTYASASDSLISKIELILNLRTVLKSAYWLNMKSQDRSLFGSAMDTGYAMEIFMEDNDFSQLLALNNPIIQKSVNLKATTTGSGYLYMLKNIYVD